MAAALRESQRTEKTAQPAAAATAGRGQAEEELTLLSSLRTQGPIRRGRRNGHIGRHSTTIMPNAERRTARFLDQSRGMGPCVRRDDDVAERRAHMATSASVRGRFLAAALGDRFERGL